MTTGIFEWIAAHAAEEETEKKKKVTPYRRTLKGGGELNEKYPDGIENLKSRLKFEGHKVVNKGKKYFVENFKKSLVDISKY